jgi:hypothetical protein
VSHEIVCGQPNGTILFHYITILLKMLYIHKNSTLCVYNVDYQKFLIESSTLNFSYQHHPEIFEKNCEIFKIVLSKKLVFLYSPAKCQNQTEISKDTSKMPLSQNPHFLITVTSSRC